jgi:hypothetical protein
MSRNPASILFDVEGNPVAVLLEDSVYRLAVSAKLQNADGDSVDPISSASFTNFALVNKDMLEQFLIELGKIRTLLEIVADERVSEKDIGQ